MTRDELDAARYMAEEQMSADSPAVPVILNLVAEVERLIEQRDHEVWGHAGCLSIAEGCPDWDKPGKAWSLAMRTVAGLRAKMEALRAAIDGIAEDCTEVDADRVAYAAAFDLADSGTSVVALPLPDCVSA